jgi:hypothetical protein
MNGDNFYAMSRSSGGKCIDFRDESLVFSAEENGRFPFRVTDKRGGSQVQGEFSFSK